MGPFLLESTMNFQGVYTAIITPFTSDGSTIDYDRYAALIERQIAAGIDGIVPCGTTGESPTLAHDEHAELIRKTVEFAAGRTRVIAGTGSNSTAEAVQLTEHAARDGVDAVMLVNPYYNKPSQRGLYEHFKTIANVTSLPVVLYNIQARTGVNVEVDTLQRLAELPNLRCVKEASGDLGQMIRLRKACPDLSILSGDDNIVPAVMGIGGNGVISVASNLYPARMVTMMKAYLAGDFQTGNAAFYDLLEIMGALFWDTNPVPVKAAAEIMGLSSGALRLPLMPLEADLVTRLKAVLDRVGPDAGGSA